ncbi:MAG TPA: pyrroline-5-carboxylate reductase [Candidatus Methylomirabilis sp.]|nr:pyrroline-5-carboxylate reductase [Candidatus Methylomirabilis sp.]
MLQGKGLGFVGGGNMGEALLRGLLAAKLVGPESLLVSDVREDRLTSLRETYGVRTHASNAEVARQADILLLAVKPQVMGQALDDLVEALDEKKLVISIAAGIPTSFILDRFSFPLRVVRVMPNTPALVLEGMSALARGLHATAEDLETTRRLFETVGKVVVVDESLLDAVTGLSGSGPAYIFLVIEALADAGVKVGLPRDVAHLLAAQTVRGAARMALETGKHPGQLKDMVTSPGGTTIAGLHALEQGGVRAAFFNAVEAATLRSRELGRR